MCYSSALISQYSIRFWYLNIKYTAPVSVSLFDRTRYNSVSYLLIWWRSFLFGSARNLVKFTLTNYLSGGEWVTLEMAAWYIESGEFGEHKDSGELNHERLLYAACTVLVKSRSKIMHSRKNETVVTQRYSGAIVNILYTNESHGNQRFKPPRTAERAALLPRSRKPWIQISVRRQTIVSFRSFP